MTTYTHPTKHTTSYSYLSKNTASYHNRIKKGSGMTWEQAEIAWKDFDDITWADLEAINWSYKNKS